MLTQRMPHEFSRLPFNDMSLLTIELIAIQIDTDIHGAQGMNYKPLTFHLVPPSSEKLSITLEYGQNTAKL